MKIAVIGIGQVGGALGSRWARAGHEVIFGVRDITSSHTQAVAQAGGPLAHLASMKDAEAAASIIALAVPWTATQAVLKELGDLTGKIVVDCTNPIGPGGWLAVGHTTSGGEQVAAWASGARVVKAFNSTGWQNMINTDYGALKPTMFLCGDDAEAKRTVAELAEVLGFEACDSGPLYVARYLEPLAKLWVQLAYSQGWGSDIAFKIIKR